MEPAQKKQIAELKFVYSKINEMYDLFQHFSGNEWIYENKKIYEYHSKMSPEDRQVFYVDTKGFDWKLGVHSYIYGVETYMNKVDSQPPDGKSLMLIHKNKFRYFDDV